MKIKELLFTAFYAGYFPIAPGTVGTGVGVVIYVIEYLIFKENVWIVNLIVVILMVYPSIILGDAGEKFYKIKDPSPVVLDEVMGFWISVLFFPFSWKIVILAFFIFRIFDVIKPYPARKVEDLKGGLGIMLDDYIAGMYTCLLLHGMVYFSKYFGVSLLG